MLRRRHHRSKIRYEKNVLVALKEEYCTQKIQGKHQGEYLAMVVWRSQIM